MTTLIGQQLGRYAIASSLGRGGMAEVYRATDTKLGREVAIKVILPSFAAEPDFVGRFLREARVVASLDHPNILPVWDFGEHQGAPYLVMPCLRGGTLAQRLGGAPQPLGQVVVWLAQLAAALDAAHAAGVLHRDVKPSNVLLTRDERLVLADFGIAKLCAETTRLTRTGAVIGTPVYMAPEVAAGSPAGPEADRYSLAVMAYEMLTGAPPFGGENALSIMHQHATRPVPPVSTRVEQLSGEIDEALIRGLAKEPHDRPGSCRELTEALAAELPTEVRAALWSGSWAELPAEAQPTLELRSAASGTPPGPSAPPTEAATTPFPPPTSGSYGPFRHWGLAGLVAGAVVVAGILLLRFSDSPPEGDLTPEPTPTAPAVPEPGPPPGRLGPDPLSQASFGAGGAQFPRELLAGTRLVALRDGTYRPSADDFRSLAERMAEAPSTARAAHAVGTWAGGGLALVGGDRDGAAAVLDKLVGSDGFLRFWGPSALTLLARADRPPGPWADWELALGYGDPRRTAGTALDRLLDTDPGNRVLRFGRALVHRLDGEHEAVIRNAQPVYESLTWVHEPEVHSFTAQVVADAHAVRGRADGALLWYRRALDAGGAHGGLVVVRAVTLARERGGREQVHRLLRHACDRRIRAGCELLQRFERRQDRSRGRRQVPNGWGSISENRSQILANHDVGSSADR